MEWRTKKKDLPLKEFDVMRSCYPKVTLGRREGERIENEAGKGGGGDEGGREGGGMREGGREKGREGGRGGMREGRGRRQWEEEKK